MVEAIINNKTFSRDFETSDKELMSVIKPLISDGCYCYIVLMAPPFLKNGHRRDTALK